jgi:hypothetical protein
MEKKIEKKLWHPSHNCVEPLCHVPNGKSHSKKYNVQTSEAKNALKFCVLGCFNHLGISFSDSCQSSSLCKRGPRYTTGII